MGLPPICLSGGKKQYWQIVLLLFEEKGHITRSFHDEENAISFLLKFPSASKL